MDQATELAAAATDDDPEVGLAAVVALRGLLGQLAALQARAARKRRVLRTDDAPALRNTENGAP